MDARRRGHRGARDDGHEVPNAGQGQAQQQDDVRVRLDQPIERQLEHEEADVLAEGRVDLAERHAVHEQLDRVPAPEGQAAHAQGHQQRDAQEAPEDRTPHVGHLDGLAPDGASRRGPELPATEAAPAHVAVDAEPVEKIVEREASQLSLRNEPPGEPEVEPEGHEGDGRTDHEEQDLRADAGPEDVAEAHALEPDRVRREPDGHRKHRKEDDDQQGDRAQHHPAATYMDLGKLAVGRAAHVPPPATAETPTAETAPPEDRAGPLIFVVVFGVARVGSG